MCPLWGQVIEAWEDLSQDVEFFNELDSTSSRVREVVESEGRRTGYTIKSISAIIFFYFVIMIFSVCEIQI